MRRGSIVGPLLLIVIGALFLANNLRPDLNFWQIVAQYWPVLLVVWGVLRLLEIAIWYLRGKLLPERGISGGEWFAIVLICLIGSGMFAVHNRGFGFQRMVRIGGLDMFGEPHDFDIAPKTLQAGKAPRVIIENFRGNARIVGSDVEEVRVSGRKSIRALRREEAEAADRDTPLDLTQQGDSIIVRSNQDRTDSRLRVNIDLEIAVPKGATVEARGRYGDFDVTDITGDVEVQSDNAGIRVQNIGGRFKADLRRSDIIRAVDVKGAVDLNVSGRSDNLELENIQGPVTINGSYYELALRKLAQTVRFDGTQTDFRLERCPGTTRMTPTNFEAENVVGPLTLTTTRSKDVQITDATESIEVSLDRGDIHVRSSKPLPPKMDLRTRKGSLVLELPDAAKFALRGSTNHGEVFNDYGSALTVTANERNGSLAGSSGAGPEIVLSTDRGDVTVRKVSGELLSRPFDEEPPPPPKPPKPVSDLRVEKS